MNVPPQNIEAEESVLGALMVSTTALRAVTVASGLRREHFYRPNHALIFDAIEELVAANKPVEALSVCAQLNSRLKDAGGKDFISSLASMVPVAGNADHYARLVVEAASLRAKLLGAQRVIEGVGKSDTLRIQEGIEAINRDVADLGQPSEPHEVRDELIDYLQTPGEPEVFRLPWEPLNAHIGAGGYLRGEFSLLVGWTSLGKSLALDQMLAAFAEQGYRCHLFTTEMSRLERSMRYASAKTAIPYGKLIRRTLTDDEMERVVAETMDFPFGIRSAEGWSVNRIVQEIAARNVDIAAIDPLNLIRFEGGGNRTAWYDDVLERLKSCAVGANCHITAVAQLNMARARDPNPPAPALRDIRDSGTAQYIATHILSLHRKHRDGEPTKSGELRFLKVRNGIKGRCEVTLVPETLSFEVKPPKPTQETIDYSSSEADPVEGVLAPED